MEPPRIRGRDPRRRHRTAITVAGSLLAAAVLGVVLAGHRGEFATALASASISVLLVATVLQVVALLARSEAWHGCVEAAGGTVPRRVLYRASSMGAVGTLVNAQLGVASRIAALRASAPADAPRTSTLVAAEFPIVAIEAMLAALTSFTLVGPLGLPWWLPAVAFVVVGALSTGLRHLALRTGRHLWQGLAVLRSARGGRRLVAFVLVAVFAQIFRNWLLLHAVGVDASFFDAIAVLIAMVTLSQLPVGPSVGAAAAVLILGRDGVGAVAAAGVLSTATGVAGGLCFAVWAGADRLWAGRARAYTGVASIRKGPMTRPSCPGCRLRFSGGMPPKPATCPLCGEPLEPMAAEAVLGYQLVVAPMRAGVTDVDGLMSAVAIAAREGERDE